MNWAESVGDGVAGEAPLTQPTMSSTEPVEMRLMKSEVGPLQIGAEARAGFAVGLHQMGLCEHGFAEVGVALSGTAQIGLGQVGTPRVAAVLDGSRSGGAQQERAATG